MELYEEKDSVTCECEKIIKDLRTYCSREFPLNKLLVNDSMVIFTPVFNIGANIMSPNAKDNLYQIIAFMQRHPSIKIKFVEYNHFFSTDAPATVYFTFRYYLQFYGIKQERITAKTAKCKDPDKMYCGPGADFTRIGFIFYKDK